MGLTGGNIAYIGLGLLMMKKGKGYMKEIGTAHLASSLGIAIVKVIDSVTEGKVFGGLHWR